MPDSTQPPNIVTRLPVLAPRPHDANKGTFGRVLIVAGSRGMSGAAVLTAMAALRGGAGLVQLAVPSSLQSLVASANPCYLTAGLPEEDGQFSSVAVNEVLALASRNDIMAIGPGLGQSAGVRQVVHALLASFKAPIVLDADGLNALQKETGILRNSTGARVLTPHPGEFARLLGMEVSSVQANRQDLAVRFGAMHGVVLVLKGHSTLVTDGQRVYQNKTGNPGMATGGTGDVLTGLIAALLGQDLDPFAAAQLGVYLHGLAGDLARDDLGEVSLIATDLLLYLPRAFQQLGKPRRTGMG